MKFFACGSGNLFGRGNVSNDLLLRRKCIRSCHSEPEQDQNVHSNFEIYFEHFRKFLANGANITSHPQRKDETALQENEISAEESAKSHKALVEKIAAERIIAAEKVNEDKKNKEVMKIKNDNYLKTLRGVNRRSMTEETACMTSSDGEDSELQCGSVNEQLDKIKEDLGPNPIGDGRVIDLDYFKDKGEEKSPDCIAKSRDSGVGVSLRIDTESGCSADSVMWSEATLKPATPSDKTKDSQIPQAFEIKVVASNYVAVMDDLEEATPVGDKGMSVHSCKERKSNDINECIGNMTDLFVEHNAELSGSMWRDKGQMYEGGATLHSGSVIPVNNMGLDMRSTDTLAGQTMTRMDDKSGDLASYQDRTRDIEEELEFTMLQLKEAEADERRIKTESLQQTLHDEINRMKGEKEKRDRAILQSSPRDENDSSGDENCEGERSEDESDDEDYGDLEEEEEEEEEEDRLDRAERAAERERSVEEEMRALEERLTLAVQAAEEERVEDDDEKEEEENGNKEEESKEENEEERAETKRLKLERVLQDNRFIEEEKQRVRDIENALLAKIEKEKQIKLQIFRDLGLDQSSKLSPLKRRNLDLEKKKQIRYEKILMEEKEKKAKAEEEIRMKSEEDKRKFDLMCATPTALQAMNIEHDKLLQDIYDRNLVEDRESKIRQENERKLLNDEARAKYDEVECAKKEERDRKMKELMDSNRRDSETWKRRDTLNVARERMERVEGAIWVQGEIARSINEEAKKQEVHEALHQLALEKERRAALEADRRTSLDSERKAQQADERKVKADIEANTRRISMLKRIEEHERRIALDEERIYHDRQATLNAEEVVRRMREETYRENERQLKAEYALRAQQDKEQYLRQESERKSRVKAEKKKSSQEEFKYNKECARLKYALKEKTARDEVERKLKQEIALSIFLEEERRISAANAKKADEEVLRRRNMEKKRLLFIETEKRTEEEYSLNMTRHNEKKNKYEMNRQLKDENANKLKLDYEKNIRDDLEKKRVDKAERKLREENDRKVVIEYERRMREGLLGLSP